jgi:hypothetical protein
MSLDRLNGVIHRKNLRKSLVTEMQQKEQDKALCAETDILPYFFYMATKHAPLSFKTPECNSSRAFESAFRAKTPEEEVLNTQYANACALYLLRKGLIPFGSHIKYTNFLKDADSHERTMGIVFGKLEELHVPQVVAFAQRGISFGMIKGLELHMYLNKSVALGLLPTWPKEHTLISWEETKDEMKRQIYLRSTEIIFEIDELIGVKTI